MIFPLFIALTVAVDVALVTSSAVSPGVPLANMAPEHACYFLCDICFTNSPDDMLFCANHVCRRLEGGNCALPEMLWLGNRCNNFQAIEQFWSSQKKH